MSPDRSERSKPALFIVGLGDGVTAPVERAHVLGVIPLVRPEALDVQRTTHPGPAEAAAARIEVAAACTCSGNSVFLSRSIVGRLTVVGLAIRIPGPLVLGPEIR